MQFPGYTRRSYFNPSGYFKGVKASGECTAAATGETMQADVTRLNGYFGASVKMRGNELFIGETGAVGSIFVVGEMHYFTRANSSSPFVRQGGFFSPTQTNGSAFGAAVDYDGARVIVGEPNVSRNADIFTFVAGSEAHEQTLAANTYTDSSSRFGRAVAINGTHALVGAPGQDLTQSDQGGVEYWENDGGTWVFRQAFTMNGTALTGAGFGGGICMANDLEAFITYSDTANGNLITVQKWTRSGSTWSFDSEFQLETYTNGGTNYADIDTDGVRLIIGQQGWDVGVATNEGVFLVTTLSGNVTTEVVGSPGEQTGGAVTIVGSEAVIGREFDNTGTTNAGIAELWDVCV